MMTGKRAARHGAAVLFLTMATVAAGEAAAQVYAIALPDVTNKRLTVKPGTVAAGGVLEIRNAVQNLGAGALTPAHSMAEAGPTLTIRFLLVRNVRDRHGLDAGSWSLDALARREVKWHRGTWILPRTVTPGTWFLCADIDPENTVRESNELNNRTCLPVTVKAAPEVAAGEDGEPEPGGAAQKDDENTEPGRPGEAGAQ